MVENDARVRVLFDKLVCQLDTEKFKKLFIKIDVTILLFEIEFFTENYPSINYHMLIFSKIHMKNPS